MYKTIAFNQEGNVAIITLNRPERLNAVTYDMYEEIDGLTAKIASDDSIKVVILTGAGRAFCVGADMSMLDNIKTPRDVRSLMAEASKLIQNIVKCPKPVIAAVNGIVAGGGMGLVIGCDIILASDKASFGPLFGNIGLYPDTGITYLLPRLIGPLKATELLLSGKTYDSQEAKNIGFVNDVISHDRLETAAKELARTIGERSSFVLNTFKRSMQQSYRASLEDCLEIETRAQEVCFFSEDFKQRLDTFLKKKEKKK